MQTPWLTPSPVPRDGFATLRRRAIFESCKWDPQVEDMATLCRWPVLLKQEEWRRLQIWAERLASEVISAEEEIIGRGMLDVLGFSWRMRHALLGLRRSVLKSRLRVMRFDFHFTTDGWRISEANTDVPGGFNEASGFTRLISEALPGTSPTGDPVGTLCDAVGELSGRRETIGLIHATAFSDDRQVMAFIARHLEKQGHSTVLLAPNHVDWEASGAFGKCEWFGGRLDCLIRFFPGEWLPNLGCFSGWHHYLAEGGTVLGNPAVALVSQNKRFPLLWDELSTSLPTWRSLLPRTIDPRKVDWKNNECWVLKPALGRVGDGIGIAGATSDKDWKTIHQSACRHPRHWVVQERFESVPMQTDDGPLHVCVGVFTVNGRSAGAYGRVAARPLIDHRAADAAVLLSNHKPEEASGSQFEPHELAKHL